uniref:Rho guanine nucleotide exchange factor 19 n=1 Tax=Myotis myotis TaxID=51298 RepID=A0A7J7ZSB3_MYOMY|nr:Rho guanine nucleotide exchange factor 19 [Myotis myotis]
MSCASACVTLCCTTALPSAGSTCPTSPTRPTRSAPTSACCRAGASERGEDREVLGGSRRGGLGAEGWPVREGVPVKGSVTQVQEGCAEKAPEEPRGGWVMDPRSSDPTVTPGPSPTSSLENPKFPGILARLEESPVCQRLPLTSFLILPFQRITRLKMLVENILKRTAQGSEDEDMATKAFNALKELVQECNASVQSMKRTEELIHLSKKIHFEGKIFPLISQARWLVRHGELVELAPLPAAPPAKLKLSSKAVYLHLFNDCLLLSRRKELGKFAVFVHAKMAELQVKDLSLKPQGIPGHVFLLQLLHGQHTKHQFLLRARTESEKQRWISAMCPSSPQEDKEVISEGEDRPQVQCVRTYKALQPDELTLEKTDILAVRTRTSDGWLEGVRLADGEKGWVPQAYVEEISSLSARLRNLRENKRITSATSKLGEPPA